MADLLERDRELAALADGLREAQRGRGRLTLVVGEAGAGKTTLARRFCADAGSARILWGACDALATPRPLGPLADIAADTGGELLAAVERGDSAHAVLAALRAEVAGPRPAIVVLEDVHWADEATLDVLRVLGRRATELPALVIATFRDDEITADHPLRQALGELARAERVGRVALAPLSPAAVRALARPHGVDGELLHARTSGNPFFVTEVLAGGEADIPPSVRDAVLARVARLTPAARHALDAVAIVPPAIEPALLEAIGGPDALIAIDDPLGAGILVAPAPPWASATSWPASPSRRPSRPAAPSPCTGAPCRRWRRRPAPTPRAWPTMRRRPATMPRR